jgi:A/G-specific adenine glycosylase
VVTFQKTIYDYYRKAGRDLPWRRTDNPYHILVSEIMLQQTQVERVLEKYAYFVGLFGGFPELARAELKDVLKAWQGLGYNRRALMLRDLAGIVVERYHGALPTTEGELLELPGIGKATAGSIRAFAFNMPSVFIETNIRRAFIHHFFQYSAKVRDVEILPLVEETLDRHNPRTWYYALMDYGSMLKKEIENPNRRSAHYQKQPPFERSDRKIRGEILRILLCGRYVSDKEVCATIGADGERIRRILLQLEKEGLVRERNGSYHIP